MIDKEIRTKLKKEISHKSRNEQAKSCAKLETFKNEIKPEKSSYQVWLKKKKSENKIKKNLIMKALKNKYESNLLEEQDKEEKNIENMKRIKEWEIQKMYESHRKTIDEKAVKIQKKHEQQIKRKEAEDHYREWLKTNMIKLKQEKKQQKIEKMKEEEQKRKVLEHKMMIQQKAKESFKNWLKNKKKSFKSAPTQSQPSIKVKKPIMLAYSPNRKLINENSFNVNRDSISETPGSSVSDKKYVKKISANPKSIENFEGFSELKKENRKKNEESESDYSDNFENNEILPHEYLNENSDELEFQEINKSDSENESQGSIDYDSSFDNRENLSF